MITADTITDEQIRDLRERLYKLYWNGDRSQWDAINTCRLALVAPDPMHRASARARCAEILNARERSAVAGQ